MKISDVVFPNLNSTPNNNWEFINYLDTGSCTRNEISCIQKIVKGSYPSRARRVVQKNDVILSTVRPNQCHYAILKEPIENMIVSTGFTVLTPKENVVAEYLYFFLTQKEITNRLSVIADSATTSYPSINPEDILNLDITLPHKSYQQKVSDILWAIEEKISLNKKVNHELEAMVKVIFNYWFIQFDFPNHEGKPYKSSGGKMVWNDELGNEIPQGWFPQELNQITDVSSESVNPRNFLNADFKHFSIPVFDETGTFGLEKGAQINSNKFLVKESDILVSKLNPWFNRVVLGEKGENIICSTEFVVWRSKNNDIKNYLYSIATNKSFINYCTKNATGTSNSHKRVNPTTMMEYKVAHDDKVAEQFGRKVDSIVKLLFNNMKQNQELITLRDSLLPLLMNGQVKVK
jgi:type I restriction enzyme, S subunit